MKNCPACSQQFDISEEEAKLRERVCETFETGPVPEPTHCPACRMQRRMAPRNERYLYTRKSDLSQEAIISTYTEDADFPVYSTAEWWSDEWDAKSFGRDFDFSRPFFEQFQELYNEVPRAALNIKNSTNSEYSNFAFDCKNAYLTQCCYRSEDLLYSYWMHESRNCIDSSYCFKSELLYDCTDCNSSYNCRSSFLSHNCTDSYFLYDCRSCTDCFGCVGLRHKQYFLFNEQLSKEEYHRRIKEFDLQNPEHITEIKKRVEELRLKHPHRDSIQDKTENCTGNYIFESKNCHDCYQVYRSEDCMYISDAEVKDCIDCYHPGWSEKLYEVYSAVGHQNTAFSIQCWDGNDLFYCDTCNNTKNCFGSIGLRNNQYCILNKQYTKEAYYELMPRIVEHMKKTGEWGEFFPIKLSPFCYNETMAHQYYPLSKEEAIASGYRWRERDPKEYHPKTYDVPARIEDVSDKITEQVLACEECGKNYRIVSQELLIYREQRIPIPKQCPDCRYKKRSTLRNPQKLFDRTCMKCNTPIKTTYAPERKETVYCEKCYLGEMY
jgi:hypothetical protein